MKLRPKTLAPPDRRTGGGAVFYVVSVRSPAAMVVWGGTMR